MCLLFFQISSIQAIPPKVKLYYNDRNDLIINRYEALNIAKLFFTKSVLIAPSCGSVKFPHIKQKYSRLFLHLNFLILDNILFDFLPIYKVI